MHDILWWTAPLQLIWRGAHDKQSPGDVVNTLFGLFKSVRTDATVRVAYHAPRGSLWTASLMSGGRLDVDLVLGVAGESVALDWQNALRAHVARGASGFELALLGPPVPVGLEYLADANAAQLNQTDEICLRFHTPLPFNRTTGLARTQLDLEELRRTLNARLRAWFGVVDPLLPAQATTVNCAFWRYNEARRRSRFDHERGAHKDGPELAWQYVNGCRGPLLLREVPKPWMPWLMALQHIHAGGPQGISGLGHFEIIAPAPGMLDRQLADVAALTEVAEDITRTNDAEPPVDKASGRVWLPHELAQHLAKQLSEASYEPEPSVRFELAKDAGGARVVERLGLVDLIAQRRMLLLVGPVIDAVLSPASIAYRKSHSREGAVQSLRGALARGFRYAVRADIEDFFPSIQHEHLFTRLDAILPKADRVTRTVLRRMVQMPYREPRRSEMEQRSQGLPQGSPISPALANLYLNGLDQSLLATGLEFVRYGDDFVVLARTQSEAEQALDQIRRQLAPEGLQLSPRKTAVHRVSDGFEFLGERIDGHAGADPLVSLAAQRKPLIVTEPYTTLGVNGDALDIRRNGQLIGTVPLRRVSELITLSPTSLSTALIERCARFKIPVAVALPSGYQMASLAPDSRDYLLTAHRQAQRFERLSQTDRVAIASEFVAAKLDNYAAWIKGNYQAGDARLIKVLVQRKQLAQQCSDVQVMRGHEGWAARECFAWLQQRVREDQRDDFKARRRERGAPDRLNSMLNFGYYLLYTRLNGLLRSHGLNPYLGYLHDAQDDYETLVADVQEVFRVHVDRTVLRLINRREVTPIHFGDAEGRFRLSREGAHKTASAFEATMGSNVGGAVLRDVMVAQVRALRAWCTEGEPLWLHRWQDAATGKSAAPDYTDQPEPDEAQETLE